MSVLVPVRDGGRWISRALRSLARQTERDFECIVVDDGSRDDTPRRLARIAQRDARFNIVTRPPTGLVAALETARAHATGRYLARMDADDLSHPARLRTQADYLDRSDVAVVGCRVESFPRRSVRDGYRRYDAWVNAILTPDAHRATRFVESNLPHPTAMMRADVLERVGGYRDVDWPEDLDLWLRLHACGAAFAKIPETLYYWRDHATRASRVDPRYGRDRFIALRAHYLARDAICRDGRVVVWGSGPIGRRLRRALADHGVGVDAFIDVAPTRIGRTSDDAPIVSYADARAAFPDRPILGAVGSRGAGARIRARLTTDGLIEAQDFLIVA